MRSLEQAFDRFCRRGDLEGLAFVFDRTAARLFHVAAHLVGPDDADDAVQQTFLIVLRERDRFEHGQPVLPWLLGILANVARKTRSARARGIDRARIVRSDAPSAADTAQWHELSNSVRDAIARLDDPERAVLQLHLRHGLSAREIADALGRPHSTVRSQIARGMDRLRGLLPGGLIAGAAVVSLPTTVSAAVRESVLRAAGASTTTGGSAGVLASGALSLTRDAVAGAVIVVLAVGLLALARTHDRDVAAVVASRSGRVSDVDHDLVHAPLLTRASARLPVHPSPLNPRTRTPEMLARSTTLPAFALVAMTAPTLAQSWTLASPAAHPTPCEALSLSTSHDGTGVVMFGGLSLSPSFQLLALDETWSFDGANWAQHTPALSPPGRFAADLATDGSRQRVVLFGGFDAGFSPNDETWEWDGSSWTQLAPANRPSPRGFHGMAFDPTRNVVVLFGGSDLAQQPFGDTWEWDGTNWRSVATTNAPSGRADMGMAWSPALQRVVLHGGDSGGTASNETWLFDGQDWTRLGGPATGPAISAMRMTSEPSTGGVLLFGGTKPGGGGTTQSDETWLLHPAVGWIRVDGASTPAAAYNPDLALLPGSGIVMFGGSDSNGAFVDDTWVFGGTGASFGTFGTGCGGAGGTPELSSNSLPQTGTTWTADVTNLATSPGFAVMLVSLTPSSPPLDLAAIGMNGCHAYVSTGADLFQFPLAIAAGDASWSQAIPPVPALVGGQLWLQAACVDTSSTNPVQLTTSNGGVATIGT